MTETRTILKLLRRLFPVILLFTSQLAFSQKEVVVKGVVLDSLERTTLDSCAVYLKATGPGLRIYTDSKGAFVFKGDFIGDTLILAISHRNFQATSRKVIVKNNL